MASLEQQEKVVFLNSQYQDNSELISRMQETLLKDIVLMKLSIDELNDTKEYLKDKGNYDIIQLGMVTVH